MGPARLSVSCNVRGRDMVGFVAEARRRIAEEVSLPPGRYHVEFGGQFEHYQRVRRRLLVVVPLAVVSIFVLLFLTYQNMVDSLRVLTGVPLGWVGGIVALWLATCRFDLGGHWFHRPIGRCRAGRHDPGFRHSPVASQGLPRDEAVRTAAIVRLRPVLMTTLVASLGFVPMALSSGMGAEVQRPLATVVIGGVLAPCSCRCS